ncbi:uncharacterized protein GBIM_10964 [Gryllus bimaculatus]|nr:uncharacterized protein GBIM_10964 [Gryllus bimaculatus]
MVVHTIRACCVLHNNALGDEIEVDDNVQRWSALQSSSVSGYYVEGTDQHDAQEEGFAVQSRVACINLRYKYMFDRESAKQVDSRVQDALFIMAVSNSCMNPLVYGSYALNCRRDCARCCACALRPTPPDPLMRKASKDVLMHHL